MLPHLDCEFLVVGGGLAGLSLALRLARSERRVICVEAHSPGFGCSASSLGLIYPISPLTAPRRISELSMEAWGKFETEIHAVEADANTAALLQSRTLLELNTPEKIAATKDAYRTIDYSPATISARDVADMLPMLTATSTGLAYGGTLHLQTDHYMKLLAKAFQIRGGVWICPTFASELSIVGGACVGVLTSSAQIRAEQTILATGAATNLFAMPYLASVRGQSFISRSEERFHSFVYTDTLDIVERTDGTLHVGSTIEEGHAELCSTPRDIEVLRGQLQATFSFSKAPTVIRTLAGIRARTVDNMPVIGETELPGLMVFGGLYRNGVVFSHLFSAMLARHLLDGDPIPSWLSPSRFSNGSL